MQIVLFLLLSVIYSYAEFIPSNELWCASNENYPKYVCFTDQKQRIYNECNNSINCFDDLSTTDSDVQQFFKSGANEYFHFKISVLGPWNASFCYGFNMIPFDLPYKDRRFIVNYIRSTKGSKQFWIPGRAKSFSPAQWKIPGERWGKQIKADYDDFSPFDCVSVNFTKEFEFKIVKRNCSDKLPMLCISGDFPFTRSACFHSVALTTAPDRCLKIEKSVSGAKVETSSKNYEQLKIGYTSNYLVTFIEFEAPQKCLVYRDPSNDTTTVAMNDLGKFETNHKPVKYNCTIKTEVLTNKHNSIEMFLYFDKTSNKLLLTVYEWWYILCDESSKLSYDDVYENDANDRDSKCGISCFTNADFELIGIVEIKALVREDGHKAIFELIMNADDPGYYWCEAHSVHNFELIGSAKIVAAKQQKGFPSAFFYNLSCTVVNCNTDLNLNMESYGNTIRKLLIELQEENDGDRNSSHKIDIHNVRIMNVESVLQGDNITVLCHARISLNGSSVIEEGDSEYIVNVKNKLKQEIDIRAHLQQLFGKLVPRSPYGTPNSVNSTEFCFSKRTADLNRTWEATQLGTSATTEELCLLPSGLPIFRKCIGDFLYGAKWEEIGLGMKCEQTITDKYTKQTLYAIDNSKKAEYQPTETIIEVENLINETKKFIAADLFYLGRIMQSVAKTITTTVEQDQGNSYQTQKEHFGYNDFNSTDSVIRICNTLMDVDNSVLRESMKLNSTNILLDAFEKIVNNIAIRNGSGSLQSGTEDTGVIIYRTPKLWVFTIDPNVSNYSGVALFSNKSSNDFKDSDYRLLMPNESNLKLLEEDNLEIGAFVPQGLLDYFSKHLSEVDGIILPVKIVIKFYFNGKLFQEDRDNIDSFVYSKIISISIPGYDRDLPHFLSLFLKTHSSIGTNSMDSCKYWNYKTWAKEGVYFINKSETGNNVVMCECSHLTPFGYLVGESYNKITELHHNALDIITLLGCSLSLIGILGIVITFTTFRKFREKSTSKVVLNLVIPVALEMILLCFINNDVQIKSEMECIILGALLHYSVLVQFSWKIIIAYLQYKRYVQVLGSMQPPRFFIKAFLLGWCMPILPVVVVILFNKQTYIDPPQFCYPSGLSLQLSVILPIVLITAGNLIIFVLIFCNIVHNPIKSNVEMSLVQFRVLLLLFFLLGLTWIFGLLAFAEFSLIFSYLFSLTATMEGFVLFIYFIVLDPLTRKLWSGIFKRFCCISSRIKLR